jgi:hypothetical protein
MSEGFTTTMNRRNAIKSAAAAALLGHLTPVEAQHVHHHAAATKKTAAGVYKPKALNAHEFKTLQHLADMIIPPEGNVPGGSGAGAPEFIDTLCSGNAKLADIFTGGIAWIDNVMRRRTGKTFVDAPMDAHTELLDAIAYRKNATAETGPGVFFFDWCRRLVVDGWTTSPEGTKALGYMGNKGMTVFQVPQASIDWAISRSPLRDA